MTVLVDAGMRIGECLVLRWEDIDFFEDVIDGLNFDDHSNYDALMNQTIDAAALFIAMSKHVGYNIQKTWKIGVQVSEIGFIPFA